MKKTDVNKRAIWGEKLAGLAPVFPQSERMLWGYKNQMSLALINRYMKGEVKNIVVAEKLYADIHHYLGAMPPPVIAAQV